MLDFFMARWRTEMGMSFDFDDFDVRSRFADLEERGEELDTFFEQVPHERAGFDEKCKIAYIFHDAALDGGVLTYHELRAAVDRKVMSDTTLIPTYQEIKNHSEAFDRIQQRAQAECGDENKRKLSLSVDDALSLHILLTRDLPRKVQGQLRQEMPLHKTYFHKIFEPDEIEEGLREVFELIKDSDFRAQHPINQAALFHFQFMKVFPFTFGAGRVGRLLMNYFLIRAGYLPAVIHQCDRQKYYEALKSGPETLRLLLIDSMESGLEAAVRHLRERVSHGITRRRARGAR